MAILVGVLPERAVPSLANTGSGIGTHVEKIMAETGMSVDAVLERRKIRRKLGFWRIAALLLLSATILALLAALGAFDQLGEKSGDHIARVSISGVITNDRPMLELLDELKEKNAVKAVILDISSPGGSTVGGEAIYEAVRKLAAEKPVVTSVGTLAASAGYMIAAATEHIVARRSSIVGSIGVIFQYGQVAKLLDKVGVEVNEIKSAPLKAEPSPFHATSPEAEAMIDRLVQDTYQWFVGIVAERRNFTALKARQMADGSIFTGSQGLENGLIDEIGDEQTAKDWLVKEKSLSEDLKIVEWQPVRPGSGLFENPAGIGPLPIKWIAGWLGIDPTGEAAGMARELLPERLFLDGLISMLHINEQPITKE
jgi:protease-4